MTRHCLLLKKSTIACHFRLAAVSLWRLMRKNVNQEAIGWSFAKETWDTIKGKKG